MTARPFRGERYLPEEGAWLRRQLIEELPHLYYAQTCEWYDLYANALRPPLQAFLACNDRYFLLTGPLNRRDALHPWLFARCREVERAPDGHLDLWSRYHYKSSIITFAGVIQEILSDPDLTVAIFSHSKPIAKAFLVQIKRELEGNDVLKNLFSDVLWAEPAREAPKWSENEGIVVKRASNPKEATVEAHGLVDGQPTSRHYGLLVYDDVVTVESVGSPEQIKKTTDRWELSDNLGSTTGVRK